MENIAFFKEYNQCFFFFPIAFSGISGNINCQE